MRRAKRTTAAEIAEKLELSRTTVSLVLSGRAKKHRIAQSTADRVLGAVKELHYRPNAAAQQLALSTFFSYPIGARAIYSDIGLILLGMSVERLTGLALDQAVHRRVSTPLGLSRTHYRPIFNARTEIRDPKHLHCAQAQVSEINFAPTEICAWRKRRVVGEVHDENAAGLGGVAGHAGIFSTAADTAALGQMYLNHGGSLLRATTVAEMTRLQAEDGTTRRGLGFALWCADPQASGNPFGEHAFGHTGFTGTSLWIDPERDLVAACLTNRVYYGRNAGGILAFRVALHRAIVEAVDSIHG